MDPIHLEYHQYHSHGHTEQTHSFFLPPLHCIIPPISHLIMFSLQTYQHHSCTQSNHHLCLSDGHWWDQTLLGYHQCHSHGHLFI